MRYLGFANMAPRSSMEVKKSYYWHLLEVKRPNYALLLEVKEPTFRSSWGWRGPTNRSSWRWRSPPFRSSWGDEVQILAPPWDEEVHILAPPGSDGGRWRLMEADRGWRTEEVDFDKDWTRLENWLGWSATCLFTRLESLAWSQQGFWQLILCRNCDLWSLCWVGILGIAFMKEMESVEELRWMKDGLFYTFTFSMQAKQRKLHPSDPITTKAS